MIVDHYYRYVPAPDDGAKLENAWNSTSILLAKHRYRYKYAALLVIGFNDYEYHKSRAPPIYYGLSELKFSQNIIGGFQKICSGIKLNLVKP